MLRHRFSPALIVLTAAALFAPVGRTAFVLAQQPGVHPVSGRVFALPMGVQGAPWLDRREREDEEDPGLALRLMRVERGSTVADIGAGSGYFTVRLAKAVGAMGKVYGVDIQPGMLDLLRNTMAREKLSNVVPVLGAVDDPKLPAGAVDLALMVDVYHEFSQPQTMLGALVVALGIPVSVWIVRRPATMPS